jgi:hypothetical protein
MLQKRDADAFLRFFFWKRKNASASPLTGDIMDDFLYNLRKSVEERNKAANSQRSGDRRCGMDRRNRRPQKQPSDRRSYPPYNRNLHEIRNLLEKFVEGQKRQEAIEEKRLALETRRTAAMERIADYLGQAAGTPIDGSTAPAGSAARVDTLQGVETDASGAATPATSGELMTRLRAEGKSYEKIANALEAAGFSTVSGRGRWRGQTVKRELAKLGVKA